MPAVADLFEVHPGNWRDRLAVSVDLVRDLSRYTDPEEMYRAFARRMGQVYPTTRQISLSRRGLDRPHVRITRYNLWKDPVSPYLEPHRLPVVSGGILADFAHNEQPRVIDDLRVTDDDPAAEYLDGQRSLLAIPLFDGGMALNTLVLTREEPAAFPREQVPELVWMSNLFGRAMQTLVLSDRLRAAYDAADFELSAIADLQQSLLPRAVPQVPGLEIAVHYQTAHQSGGDYYDFFQRPDGKLGLLVADVSGHGTPAAVLMAITHSLAHAHPDPCAGPGELLTYLNARLAKWYTKGGNFVTAVAAVIDPVAGTLTYSTAGHTPARFCRFDDKTWRPLPAPHRLPLGVDSREAPYPKETIRFHAGDRVAFYTDGLIDLTDPAGDPYGYDRLDAALAAAPSRAADTVDSVLADIDRFGAGAPQVDDRTLLVVSRV